MFQDVDFTQDIDTILGVIESNNKTSCDIRKKIESLRLNIDKEIDEVDIDSFFKTSEDTFKKNNVKREDEFEEIVSLYYNLDSDKEQIEELLSDVDDYNYERVIMRLCAESLKDIKEMSEMSIDDGTYNDDEVQFFIQNELAKIDILQGMLNPEIDDLGEVESSNKLFLCPNRNGRIKVFDDLDDIPVDLYDEIYDLFKSIINGTFKNIKKLTKSSNSELYGVTEVKSNLGRVLFKRLNHDTYAIITTFLKKTKNDRGYQDFIRNRISEYRSLEDDYKKKIEDPKYMETNDFYVEELFNKLGKEKPKEYKKVIPND